MNYNELFEELFTMMDTDDWENFKRHLEDSQFITEGQYLDLWEMGCDIHQRFIV